MISLGGNAMKTLEVVRNVAQEALQRAEKDYKRAIVRVWRTPLDPSAQEGLVRATRAWVRAQTRVDLQGPFPNAKAR